jgi:hypothetical protein
VKVTLKQGYAILGLSMILPACIAGFMVIRFLFGEAREIVLFGKVVGIAFSCEMIFGLILLWRDHLPPEIVRTPS